MLKELKRAWFLFSMWTGIVSLQGTEYYVLAPLSVLTFVGFPLLMLQSLLFGSSSASSQPVLVVAPQ